MLRGGLRAPLPGLSGALRAPRAAGLAGGAPGPWAAAAAGSARSGLSAPLFVPTPGEGRVMSLLPGAGDGRDTITYPAPCPRPASPRAAGLRPGPSCRAGRARGLRACRRRGPERRARRGRGCGAGAGRPRASGAAAGPAVGRPPPPRPASGPPRAPPPRPGPARGPAGRAGLTCGGAGRRAGLRLSGPPGGRCGFASLIPNRPAALRPDLGAGMSGLTTTTHPGEVSPTPGRASSPFTFEIATRESVMVFSFVFLFGAENLSKRVRDQFIFL